MYAESQPLRYFDRTLFPHAVHSIRCLAKLANAPATDVVIVPNATTGCVSSTCRLCGRRVLLTVVTCEAFMQHDRRPEIIPEIAEAGDR